MAAPVQKFLFDTSFDPDDVRRAAERARRQEAAERAKQEAAAQQPETPAEPAAPAITEDDLKTAHAAGYAEGEAAGRAAAQRSAENRLNALLEHVPTSLTPLIDAQRRSDADLIEHAVQIAVTMGHKLFPELARRRGLVEIEAVIRDCLADMIDEPRLVVRVADDMLDIVRARLQPMVAETGFEGAIVFMADPAMGPSDCRVDWADGGAERLSARLWDEVEATVARFFDYPRMAPPVTDDPADTDGHRPDTGPTDTP